eukprot:g11963.t1
MLGRLHMATILFGSEAWGPRSNSEVSKLLGGLRKALQKRYVFGKEPAVHPLVEDAIKRFLTMQEEALSQKASLIHKVANWNHGSHGWQQDARETKRKTLHALYGTKTTVVCPLSLCVHNDIFYKTYVQNLC